MKAGLIDQEETRLALLRGYNILDTAPEEALDEIVKLAAEICGVPVAMISLVDDDRQWFKARTGIELESTPIEMSICAHAIEANEDLEIINTASDPRTADNPLVTGAENVQFYAGALMSDDSNLPIGTLCVLDHKPKQLSDFQKRALRVLANQAMRQIELRQALGAAELLRKEVDHRVKNSLQSLEALIRIQIRGEAEQSAKTALEAVQRRLAMVSQLHEALYLSDAGAAVNLADFVGRIAKAAEAQMPQGVTVTCELEAFDVDSRSASSVGMVVTEAMTNAAKYAFADQGGVFRISGQLKAGHYVLRCVDDGPGASGQDATGGTGLGARIMKAAAQQLNGELETRDAAPGHEVCLSWPVGQGDSGDI